MRSKKRRAKKIKKQVNKIKMILCLVVEAIVILTLVVIIGWNKGVGDWMESLQRPVVRKLEMSGINSPYAVLMQVKGGKIIGNMKGDEKIYPASMTKIMTVLVAIENLDDLDQEITLTQEMFQGLYEQDATQAGFQPGETVRAIDLLYGAMLPSGAECCIALADTVGGSRDGFVELMNKKAQRIGMNGTHFCDTTGLHDPDHYSTVRDIAVLLRYALRNDTFREIIESPRHSTGVTNIHPSGITYYSTMFKNLSDPSVTGGKILGGKTGYTSEAGNTLVTAAEKNGTTYITVTMKAADLAVASTDSTALFNYGYQNFTKAQVNGGEVSVPNGVTVDNLTVQENSQNGNTVDDYYYNDYLLGSVEVPEATPTPEPAVDALSDTSGGNTDQADQNEKADTVGEEKTSAGMPELRKILLIIGAAMLLLIIILSIALAKKEKRYYG